MKHHLPQGPPLWAMVLHHRDPWLNYTLHTNEQCSPCHHWQDSLNITYNCLLSGCRNNSSSSMSDNSLLAGTLERISSLFRYSLYCNLSSCLSALCSNYVSTSTALARNLSNVRLATVEAPLDTTLCIRLLASSKTLVFLMTCSLSSPFQWSCPHSAAW